MRWLPAVGALIGLAGAGVLLAARAGVHPGGRALLAAALAVAVVAVLTGGLHLDGLADTADGLASRRSRSEALEIMRRPDIGPMAVAALVLMLLLQVASLAAISPGWQAAAALVLAAVTGRVAALLAAGTQVMGARTTGFGALVTSTVPTGLQAAAVAILLAGATGAGWAAGGAGLAARAGGAALAGLLAGYLLRVAAQRRLGGVTGDVFGAVIELSGTVVLLTAALTS
jgi:adenosylcobinamide-GDP ribazoletransferase